MTRNFKSVDLTEGIDKPILPKPQEAFKSNPAIIEHLIKSVKEEIEKIQSGVSNFTRRAIHFEKGTCPANHALKQFEADPNPKRLEVFLQLARQDFGASVSDAFKEWSNNAFKTGEIRPGALTPKKALVNELADTLFDIFRAQSTPLNQQQVDKVKDGCDHIAKTLVIETIGRMKKFQEAVSDGFASFEKELDESLKTQAKDHVKEYHKWGKREKEGEWPAQAPPPKPKPNRPKPQSDVEEDELDTTLKNEQE